MDDLFAYTLNGSTALEVPTEDYEARMVNSLKKLGGEILYLQSAGTAHGMSIEIRRLGADEHRQYTIGRAGERSTAQDRVIVWGPNRRELTLSTDELFT